MLKSKPYGLPFLKILSKARWQRGINTGEPNIKMKKLSLNDHQAEYSTEGGSKKLETIEPIRTSTPVNIIIHQLKF